MAGPTGPVPPALQYVCLSAAIIFGAMGLCCYRTKCYFQGPHNFTDKKSRTLQDRLRARQPVSVQTKWCGKPNILKFISSLYFSKYYASVHVVCFEPPVHQRSRIFSVQDFLTFSFNFQGFGNKGKKYQTFQEA